MSCCSGVWSQTLGWLGQPVATGFRPAAVESLHMLTLHAHQLAAQLYRSMSQRTQRKDLQACKSPCDASAQQQHHCCPRHQQAVLSHVHWPYCACAPSSLKLHQDWLHPDLQSTNPMNDSALCQASAFAKLPCAYV